MSSAGSPDNESPTAPRRISLGDGIQVDYPVPAGQAASKVGKGNRRSDTKPELLLRSALHRRGLRFRKDHLIRVGDLKVKPDVVFTRRRLAVFVDGCFWHGCPEHGRTPRRNQGYWVPKLARNTARDRHIDQALTDAGWRVERVWEHEDPEDAAETIADLLVHAGGPAT